MKASEFIKQLQEIVNEHGDLEVVTVEDGCLINPAEIFIGTKPIGNEKLIEIF